MATMAGRAYCHNSFPTGRVPSSSVFCLLSVILILYPPAKVRKMLNLAKRNIEFEDFFKVERTV